MALFLPRGARLVDELECVLAVLLAIVIAHLVGARNVSWAAFSGYMVMRGHVADSLMRGMLRVLGTLLGAGLALLVVPVVDVSWPLSSLVGAIIGGASLFGGLSGRRAYAWLFIGLTFEMVLLDKLEHPGLSLASFAATRVLEVCTCRLHYRQHAVNVHAASAVARGSRSATPVDRLHRSAFRHAAQGAVALALLPPVGVLFGIRDLAQGAICIMAVMIVPVSSLGVSGVLPVSRKLVERIVGCLAGAALAACVLLIAHGSAVALVIGTAAGVLVGRHIENGGHAHVYVGTQFTLAILVTLVPDSYAAAAIAPSLDRLFGILVGMALLEPILVAWHLIVPLMRHENSRDRQDQGLLHETWSWSARVQSRQEFLGTLAFLGSGSRWIMRRIASLAPRSPASAISNAMASRRS